MTPLLAQTVCDNGSAVCRWLDGTGLPDWMVALMTRVVQPLGTALVILVVTAIVAWLAKGLVSRIGVRIRDSEHSDRFSEHLTDLGWSRPDPRRERRIDSLTEIAESIVVVLVWAMGVVMAIGSFGVNLGPLIASAGIVGVALGFGAQSLVKDFLSGAFMLAEDQFGIGDVIDVGEATGVVEDITLRTTALRGADGTLWFVPNGEIRRVGNMSQGWARALLDVSVAYGADVDKAMAVIDETAQAFAADQAWADKVVEPPELVGVEDLAADAVVIRVWLKTEPGEQWAMTRELRRRIKAALDDAQIEVPFPQRTVWLRHESGAPDDWMVDDAVPPDMGPSDDRGADPTD